MPAEHRTETITSREGGTFPGHLTLPPSGSGSGLVLFHELLGVNVYIRAVAERLANLGYVVLAPDLFWRIDPDHTVERHDEGGFEEAMARLGDFDWEQGFRDGDAALAHLDRLEETTGSVGVLGFCMGGLVAFGVAVQSEPDAAVSYYGSGVADMADAAGQIHCPILFHFGDNDPFIPMDQVEVVQKAFAGRDDATVVVHEGAGHAFDNEYAAVFHDPVRAKEAWGQTADFLRRSFTE
ncbi:MAG: dienelactone hydrolase family protein [Actinobacteria bacterium]|nr:dienelactone hydrolase family protein [Actinomycetota bacterium]